MTGTLTVWRDNPRPAPRWIAEVVFEKIAGRWEPLEADPELEWALEKDAHAIRRYLAGIKAVGFAHLEFSWNLEPEKVAELRAKLGK